MARPTDEGADNIPPWDPGWLPGARGDSWHPRRIPAHDPQDNVFYPEQIHTVVSDANHLPQDSSAPDGPQLPSDTSHGNAPYAAGIFGDNTVEDDWTSHASLDSKDYDLWRMSGRFSDPGGSWSLHNGAIPPNIDPRSADDTSSFSEGDGNDALDIGVGGLYASQNHDPEEPPERLQVEHPLRDGIRRTAANIKSLGQRVTHPRSGAAEPVWLQMKEQNEQNTEGDKSEAPVYTKLRGRSLMVFGPNHPVRVALARLITAWWFEPVILCLVGMNLIVLIISSSRNVYLHPPANNMLTTPEQRILLGIFVCYTIEVIARIIVSGLVVNPPSEDSEFPGASNTREFCDELWKSSVLRIYYLLYPYDEQQRDFASNYKPEEINSSQPGKDVYGETNALFTWQPEDLTFPRRNQGSGLWRHIVQWSTAAAKRLQRTITMRESVITDSAYLRHSWNRVDFIAVVMYWIAAGLQVSHADSSPHVHIFIFRALSVLRCARVLTLFEGTVTILLSLKRVAPLLLRVFSFVGFAMVLFSVIGIQSFKGSYRRNCVWIGDLNNEAGVNVTLHQLCGGGMSPTNATEKISYYNMNGELSKDRPKGFICPFGQKCVEQAQNPSHNVQGYDNLIMSLLQVSIIVSLNGWSDSMYDLVDADYYTACIYYIIGIILLNFWLANLFVAVISHSFAALASQTRHSAFAAVEMKKDDEKSETEGPRDTFRMRRRRIAQVYKRFWGYTKYVWLIIILASLSVQASQKAFLFPWERRWRNRAEQGFTIVFAVEIFFRFLAYLLDSDVRGFFESRQNCLDLFLAVVTCVIQIPVIKNHRVYAWFTVFQLARFYRVIAAIPRMRLLLLRVVGSMKALVNMVMFLLLIIFVAALFSVQLFRGDVENEDDGEPIEMTWKHLFNGFLGMYQIFSSENWSDTAMNVIGSTRRYKQGVIAGIFLVGWFIFSNLIVLQMFIAVINENFRIAEGDKYKQQMEHYLRHTEPPKLSKLERLLLWLSPFREAPASGNMQENQTGESHLNLTSKIAGRASERGGGLFHQMVTQDTAEYAFGKVQRILRLDKPLERTKRVDAREREEAAQLPERRAPKRQETMYEYEHVYYDDDEAKRVLLGQQQLDHMRQNLGLGNSERDNEQFQRDYVSKAQSDPKIQLAKFIAEHPWYDRSWYIFSNRNVIRRLCQSMTPPARGERIFGRQVNKWRYYAFQTCIFAAIVGSVVVAGYATPMYRKEYVILHDSIYGSWFSVSEISLSAFFVLEFFVKTIADGFVFTPNAYLLNTWNLLDMFVLISLLINVISELAVVGGVSHFTRALKAFRALRLINLSSLMRDTFHAVMIAGAGRIFDAGVLALLYIVPYAVWGQNLFAGLLYACNDTGAGISTKLDCHGEYSVQPLEWSFLAPRTWRNPDEGSMYSFDDFKSALLILFEIVSLEGWIDVMSSAMAIVGRDMQPKPDATQVNAVFFLIYNLIGAVSVLSLFVAVIIENFQRYSGAAFLTTEQRQWLDLKRQLNRQTASKRPTSMPTNALTRWCYDAATLKKGWWLRSMTLVPLVTFILLTTQYYGEPEWADFVRNGIYCGICFIQITDLVVRVVGLGWYSFRRSLWNLYDIAVVAGVLTTTVIMLARSGGDEVTVQLQKIFLTALTLKLIQRSDSLNQLFTTALGSVPAILSLFLLWFTMFLVWAIMLVEVFGLTKWGINETHAKNFTTLWGTLIFLSMTSTGEGWNSYMHDYTVESPLCTSSPNYLESDCGSRPWAYFLFISWNIISMFIFLNMFTGTVVENFSYVYHLKGSTALSRSQMRQYKETWSRFDPQGSGYITRDQVVPFLSSLTGMFEVGLYPDHGRVRYLLDHSRPIDNDNVPSPTSNSRLFGLPLPRTPHTPRTPRSPGSSVRGRPRSPSTASNTTSPERRQSHFFSHHVESGVDIVSLDGLVNELDTGDLRMRRMRLNQMYHEALLSDKGKGISFNTMLFILAYHKLCTKPTSMVVSEFIERRQLMERIDKDISLERVRGLLRMVYLRRRFLAARAGERLMRVAIPSDTRGYPTITVEGDACSPTYTHVPLTIDVPRAQLADGVSLLTPTSQTTGDYFSRASLDQDSSHERDSYSPSHISPAGARRRLSFQASDGENMHSSTEDVSAWNSVLSRMSPTLHYVTSPFDDPPRTDSPGQ